MLGNWSYHTTATVPQLKSKSIYYTWTLGIRCHMFRTLAWIPRRNPQMKNKLTSTLQTQKVRRIEVRIISRISNKMRIRDLTFFHTFSLPRLLLSLLQFPFTILVNKRFASGIGASKAGSFFGSDRGSKV